MSSTALEVVRPEAFSLSPRNIEEAMSFAKLLSQSDMVPKDFIGKPANCLVAIQWGMELGLQPLQAMQNIAVINGRPSLWGDSLLALVRASPLCEYVHETLLPDGTAECRTKRRGDDLEHVKTFSDADAKLAGLWNKAGPWTTSPKRMKQMRARAFLLRDVYPDVLRGMAVAEEVMDIPQEKDVTPQAVPGPVAKSETTAAAPAAPAPIEGSATEVEPEPAEGATAALLGEGPLRILRAKLKRAALTETDLIAKFGPIDQLKFSQFDDVQAWIAQRAEQVA